ncbi:RNA polymerase subunit sigma [Methylobacillus sp. MM3]|jgi:RNA polymerase sigma factor (sigma-70 family)|uniref:sigma-70 family RNA polymerase sigma factor n=1 Tax=Methylobacillus sp. MM3 TaxID=1848039 RepID=UPI0007DF91E2|nr:sigma-70 family RNA polymerase sigma factor [Methylobacillus sp. MM3]OAJ69932.1 RNA polymerase subunit sigma [Methylobacillus sp. MM3]
MAVGETTLHQAVHTLYSAHHGWLLNLLSRKTGCVAHAADLTQDTFVRIMLKPELEALREPRAFLATVANGILVNWYRRQTLERAYLEALAQLPEPETPAPEQRLALLETLYEIDAALDSLPAKAKHAFLLSQIEGRRYSEIARLLEVSEITVKRYMKQAFRLCLEINGWQ